MTTDASRTGRRQRSYLRPNAIGTPALIFFVVATVGPMGAVLAAAPLVFTESGAGAAGVYILSAALFAVFSIGYLAMNRHLGSTGGLVVYIAKGFSHRAGTAASYVALLTYLSLLCALYGGFGVFAHQTFLEVFEIDIQWQVWALGCLFLIAALAYNKVELSVRVMGVLLVLEVLVVLWLDFAIFFQGGEGGGASLSLDGLSPTSVFSGGFGLAFLFALSSFGSFEATVVYSEEAKSPRKTIPRATYGSLAVLGVFYSVTAWAVANGVGTANVQQEALANPTGLVIELARGYLGEGAVTVMNVLVVTSFFAIVAGVTNILSRYVFALGRAGILPQGLATTHGRHGGPSVASLVVSGAALLVLCVFFIAGTDPYKIYTWLLAIGTVAILCVVAATSAAAITYFYMKNRDSGESTWAKLVAPAVSAAAFVASIVLAIKNFSLLVGAAPGDALGWIWLVVPAVGILGFVVGSVRGPDGSDFSTVDELLGNDGGEQ
ncbi:MULTISPECIES: APC family permease [unclassified Nocardioides]|uniref:APC family permease n=1 Tax=unclassified Nocardioides TaxID=2615069 RepID=UPI0009EF95A5|nr:MULTISPECIES: APC family permease [unclassified Nocardioides]GAW48993.1 Putative amino acid transporter [Nocardioides sp. PD653-B2]GAW55208.1 putative amino acid transporter [Nocardioides sp. PD653]